MRQVDRLLDEYATAFKAGKTDPWPYLDQVEGEQREELDRKMDEFLLAVEPDAMGPGGVRGLTRQSHGGPDHAVAAGSTRGVARAAAVAEDQEADQA